MCVCVCVCVCVCERDVNIFIFSKIYFKFHPKYIYFCFYYLEFYNRFDIL